MSTVRIPYGPELLFTLVFIVGLLTILAFVGGLAISFVQTLLEPSTWDSLIHGLPYLIVGIWVGAAGSAYYVSGGDNDE